MRMTWNIGFAGTFLVLLASAQTGSATMAVGGAVSETNGYRIHSFTGSGTLSVLKGGTGVEVLVVGGGGGGGVNGGGGGAGGLIYYPTNFNLLDGDYAVRVGAGGAAGVSGSASVFSNTPASVITAAGGGAGGSDQVAGSSGGSGGGGGAMPSGQAGKAGGAASPAGQGNAGGSGGTNPSNWSGDGGGGGAAASGSNGGNDGNGGNGGAGRFLPQFASVAPYTNYFAGGGGGGEVAGSVAAQGGVGGGGRGGLNAPGSGGAANTGGGGGGGGYNNPAQPGGAGGAGVVIVRYALVAGSPVITNAGAVNVDVDRADLVGNLTDGNVPATVTCYWGTNDGGTIASAWMSNVSWSVSAPGYQTNSIASGLQPGTRYYFRFYITNDVSDCWAPGRGVFSTLGAPTVDNAAGASGTGATSATLNGTVIAGNPSPSVWIYCGTSDGGTNKSSWSLPAVPMGVPGIGSFATNLTGLSANQTLWYRCYASNTYGEAWASASSNFITGSPTLTINDRTVTEGAAGTTNNVLFTVTLSATSAVDVTVNYSTSNGTATAADNDYVPLTNLTLTIPAGSVTGLVAVQVTGDGKYENNETFYVNLSNAVNATISDGQGLGTINNDDWALYVRHGGAGAQNGSDWANAYASLQTALDAVPYSQAMTINVQASVGMQVYVPCARANSSGSPLSVTFQGGWQDVDGTPVQTGRSVVSSAAGNQDGLALTATAHNSPISMTVNRFVISNVIHGVAVSSGSGYSFAGCDLTVNNTSIQAKNDGIYVSYPKGYARANYGGIARVTAENVEIAAGLSGAGHGVYANGYWDGSIIRASGTNESTGIPNVSTITSSNGCGVYFVGINQETTTFQATISNTVVYGCTAQGIYLDVPTVGGDVGYHQLTALLRNCTIVENAGDGLRMRQMTASSGHSAKIMNSIFANNGGQGVALGTNGAPTFTCTESYNNFYNDNLYTNGANKTLNAADVISNPQFYARGLIPSPWYRLGTPTSSCYRTASGGILNRGAYQGDPPGDPIISTYGVANVGANGADLVGNLTEGVIPATVSCYWGLTDGGTDASFWMTNNTWTATALGYQTNSIVGELLPGTRYYFRYHVSNVVSDYWSTASMYFSTVGVPAVDNADGASGIGYTNATLSGSVISGNPSPDTWIYLGTLDGDTNKASWNLPPIAMGAQGAGAFSTNIVGLTPGQQYWYRCYASNSYGEAWSEESLTFTTVSGAPIITNLEASGVGAGAAFLNGQVVSDGAAPIAAVKLYWGVTDGGTNATQWAHTNVFSGGGWNEGDTLTTNITTLSTTQDYFYAYGVENIYGAVVAGPSAWFAAGGTYWMQQTGYTVTNAVANDKFGVAVSLDGDRMLVGALGYSVGGGAFVYDWNGTNWIKKGTLTASDRADWDMFGSAVSLEGNRAVVGAYGSGTYKGAVYVYDWNGTAWIQSAKLTASDGVAGDYFGCSVSLSGNRIIAGSYYKATSTGAAYVYDWNGTAWIQSAKLTASDGVAADRFGYAVSLSGNRAVVSAPYKAASAGAAYVFDWAGGTNWTQSGKLTASDGAAGDMFGYAVSLSGGRMVVAAPYKASYAGAAYVYDWNGVSWAQSAKLAPSGGLAGDYFGCSVSLSGNRVLAGAPGKAGGMGSAYVYDGNGAIWVKTAELTASDGAAGDQFGYAASLDGNRALVGAFFKSDLRGSTYVYNLSTQRNTAPVANNQGVTTIVGETRTSVVLSYVDPDPEQFFNFRLVTAPTRGTLEYFSAGAFHALTTGTWDRISAWVYTPSGASTGTDSFAWQMTDGLLNSGIATVSVNIIAASTPNTPPVFKAGAYLKDGTNTLSVWMNIIGQRYIYANAKNPRGPAMAAPDLVDWNNDGLMDMVVGQTDGRIALFLNKGSVGNPVFDGYTYLKGLSGAYIGTPSIGCSCYGGSSPYAAPRVVDWNNDGKKDLIIGDWCTWITMYVFINIGTDDAPVFGNGSAYPFVSTIPTWWGAGGNATPMPCVADMNGDGILDVISGENNKWYSQPGQYGGIGAPSGLINVFFGTQNDHTSPSSFVGGNSSGVYPKTLAKACPVQSRKSVVAVDFAGSGKNDLVTGMQDGSVWFSPNVGTAQTPVFTNCYRLQAGGVPIIVGNAGLYGQDPGYMNQYGDYHGRDWMNYGNEARIAVADLDGDGLKDLVVGNVNGNVMYFPQYNPRPVAIDQRLLVPANGSKNITLTARVDTGHTVNFNVLTQPVHGTLSGTAPDLVYTPTQNYMGGTDSFTFQAADGGELSRTGTVVITVKNYAPVALDQGVVVATMNRSRTIMLQATDECGLPLTYSIVTPPAGSYSLLSNVVTYTSATNCTGPDSFTWKANNGYRDSSIATVSVDVALLAVNFQPTAYPVPSGYVKDDGSAFDAGRGYGWDANRTGQVNAVTLDPDPKVTTRMTSGGYSTWTCEVPDGSYYVSLAYGNRNEGYAYEWDRYQDIIALQGVTVVSNGVPDYYADKIVFGVAANRSATVTNGLLSVRIGGGSFPTRLDYLEIRPARQPAGWATFVARDNSTAGNWQGVYGAEGYWITRQWDVNGRIMSDESMPAYLPVTSIPGFSVPAGSGGGASTLADPTTDARALQHAGKTTRIKSYCYSGTTAGGSMWWDLDMQGGLSHRVAMYFADWWGGRAATVTVRDGGDWTVLDTRSMTNFTGGAYLVWDLKGHVLIQVTGTAGAPVFSGLFFGSGVNQDLNHDGLPDWWQFQYYGSLTSASASPWADPYGKGMNNMQSYLAGLDPTSAGSLLQILDTDVDRGTNFVIRWPGAAGRFYSIDGSTNLQAGFPFVVGSGIPASPVVNCVTVNVNQASQQYFRVRVEE